VTEGYYHLTEANLLDEAVEEICSLEFVYASGLCGDVFNLLCCISRCLPLYEGREDKKKKLDHYLRWIRKKANSIASNPSWMVRSTAGEEPSESVVRSSALELSHLHLGSWNKCSIITCVGLKSFGNLEMDLVGHSKDVKAVSWSHNGHKIVSGSHDMTIKIWDADKGELLHTLEGHSWTVNSVSWNRDDSKIISGSEDKTIKIWDAGRGELLNTLNGHSHGVTSVSWNHDCSKIVSAGGTSIRIWDDGTGELLNTLEGHSHTFCSVSWNPAASKIVSGSFDKTIKIWDASSGEVLNTLEGGSFPIFAVSWIIKAVRYYQDRLMVC
jgi:WD40 repeat protein